MEKLKILARYGLLVLFAVATVEAFRAPPAPAFQKPDLARLIFFHLPCAITATLFLFFGSYLSLRYLRAKTPDWDVRAVAANELGSLLAVLTMITGVLFSKVQWGAWWQWDPRQTSFLMLLLLYAAYFALRGGIADPIRRAANSAAYSVAMVLPTIFLVFVFPRLPQVQSFHPSNTVAGGGFDATYGRLIGLLIVLMLGLTVILYKMQVRASALELKLEEIDAGLDDRGDRAARGVVRPVSVPETD